MQEGKRGIILAGLVIGFLGVFLVLWGNPPNMGICAACFIRDIAGGLGLHRADVVQYLRPEIMGIVLGAFLTALWKKEFQVKGGSSPVTRFLLGFVVMIGALMFLGCPLRMALRLGGGDLNAAVGLAGFAAGIGAGIAFLNKGFSLKRNYRLTDLEGYIFPALNMGLLVLLVAAPAFLFFSAKGPGSQHAPLVLSQAARLAVGALAQRTRLCMVGGIRDLILFKDSHLILGFVAIIMAATCGNLLFGFYKLGFAGQPVAHTDGLWNFTGMLLAGWGSVLLGGCPLRQLIMASEGNSDAVVTVCGMLAGAAFSHNFGLAASAAGPAANGKIAVILGLILVLAVSYYNSDYSLKTENREGVDTHAG